MSPDDVVIEVLPENELDRLEPLWGMLLARHAGIWSTLPARSLADSWPRRRAQYLEWLRGDGSCVLVARRGEALVGYTMVGVQEGDETFDTGERLGEVHTLVVAAGERDAGIGSRLFDAALDVLAGIGVEHVLVGALHGNHAALAFYERRGFTPFVHELYGRTRRHRRTGDRRDGAAQDPPATEAGVP